MRNFDPTLAAEMAKEILTDFYLLELQFSTALYYTTFDRPVSYGGKLYTPVTFQTGDLKIATALSVDKVTLEIDNSGLQFSAYLLLADQRNKVCKLSYGVLLTDGTLSAAEIFNGFLGQWEIDGENKVRLIIVNEFVFWSKRSLRGSGSGCPWVFKGTECSYSGSGTWCDQSWERCGSLSNRDNFGGNPYINVTAEKKIWWGKIPK